MNKNFKHNLKELFKISFPIIFEQIFVTLMGVINIIMVSNVGEYAVSGIAMIDSISNIIISIFSAFATGGTILVAQSIGKNDKESTNNSASSAIILSVLTSILVFLILIIFKNKIVSSIFHKADKSIIESAKSYFTIIVFSYPILAITQTIFGILRGSKNTKAPMFITILMNISNILLGYLLIFEININIFQLNINKPSFGISGAAYSLLISRFIGLIISIVYLMVYSKTIKINNLKYLKFNFNTQKKLLVLGIPTSLESSIFQIGRLITQVIIVSMGSSSIFANSIASSNLNILYIPGNAFSTGVMILIGQKIGKEDIDEITNTTKFGIKTGIVFFSLLCLLFAPFTSLIINMYNSTYESSILIKKLMFLSYIAIPLFWPLSFITPAALRATGDVKFTMTVSVITMFVFRIFLGFIFGIILKLNILGVWFAMYIDWIMRGICFYTRLVSGRWKKHLNK